MSEYVCILSDDPEEERGGKETHTYMYIFLMCRMRRLCKILKKFLHIKFTFDHARVFLRKFSFEVVYVIKKNAHIS